MAIMNPKLFTCCLSFIILFLGCSKSGIVYDPCVNTNYIISHSKTESIGTSNNGTITISEPRGDTISYKLNDGAYQASWSFTNLAPGNYIVTVKNQKGCSDTAQIT